MDYNAPPPAYYSHPPKGMMITAAPATVYALCRRTGIYGCAITKGALLGGKPVGCLVVIRNDVPPTLHRYIANHEIAHCNGWHHPHER